MPRTKVRCDIRQIKKKIAEKGIWGLFRYEEEYAWNWARDRLDYLAQLYPKAVAFKEWKPVKCDCCNKIMYDISEANWSHWIDKGAKGMSAGNYWCRWEKRNVHCCTAGCNGFDKESHHNRLTARMVRLYWLEWVDAKLDELTKIHKKPTRDEMMEKIKVYEDEFDSLSIKY